MNEQICVLHEEKTDTDDMLSRREPGEHRFLLCRQTPTD